MSMRDRKAKKWTSSFMLPEHIEILKELAIDYHRTAKPNLDEFQIEEFENKIHYAMEYAHQIKVTIWEDDLIGSMLVE